ncbi:hypothetical protein PFNF54_00757 [Plasmodium falciparum NF54]|uniref:Uncharacterized protein n=1 Tax=Plasmodium falciparum (isolate NF54) TaxID=5843 RepID=W7KLK1_PLAFO|nr:hypothetical protein PFNF54_00757 [Plasmodium falciparum NF54]
MLTIKRTHIKKERKKKKKKIYYYLYEVINVLCHLCPITIKYASLLNLVSSLCSHKLYYFFFLILIKEYDEYSNKNTNIHLCSLPNNSFIKMKEKNSYETYKKKNS